MRQFYLENEYGQRYDLNNIDTGFMQKPDGLGYVMDASYTKLGSTWTRNKFDDSQASISGEVVFGSESPYEAAAQFFNWIRKAKILILHRITPAGEYLRDVDLISCGLTEIGEGGVLTIPVQFSAKSLWYSKDTLRYFVGTDLSDRITRYSYRTAARFHDGNEGSIDIRNDGSVDAPFTVVMTGPIVNPVMALKQDGVTLYSVAIAEEAASGEEIRYSSVDNDLYCQLVSGSTVTNLVGSLNIANTNFFKIPVGDYELVVSADAAITEPINVTVYKQYRVV